ncbi:MAG TPA: (4Fe-4S)-binding protein [Candidatus Binataceae bacterium]|nr:(4Fe-4S)-binding protein [Candidatus Binataceae bacterium]
MALEVIWDKHACIHSGKCVRTLPQVFKVESGKFVIDPSAASEHDVRQTVEDCPSHALRIKQ